MGAEWAKFKTKQGKELCKAAVLNDCFNKYLNYDEFAAAYPGIDSQQVEKYQKEYYKTGVPGLSEKGEKLGRPTGNFKNDLYLEKLAARRVKNGDFPSEILERYKGDVVPEDLESQKELYTETILSITERFKEENKDLMERPQKLWVNKFYITVKTNIPRIPYENIDLINYVYDIYSLICYDLGILPSVNGFCIFSGVDYYIIKRWVQNREGLNPAYRAFIEKALGQTENNLVNKLTQHDGANTNIMFLLNTCFGYDKKTIIEHLSSEKSLKSVDDIPIFKSGE